MAKIYALNKEYTGVSASVFFVKGVGETENPHLINWFKDKGYKVEEEKKKENKAVEEKQDEENIVIEESTEDEISETANEVSDKETTPIEEVPKKPNRSSKK